MWFFVTFFCQNISEIKWQDTVTFKHFSFTWTQISCHCICNFTNFCSEAACEILLTSSLEKYHIPLPLSDISSSSLSHTNAHLDSVSCFSQTASSLFWLLMSHPVLWKNPGVCLTHTDTHTNTGVDHTCSGSGWAPRWRWSDDLDDGKIFMSWEVKFWKHLEMGQPTVWRNKSTTNIMIYMNDLYLHTGSSLYDRSLN